MTHSKENARELLGLAVLETELRHPGPSVVRAGVFYEVEERGRGELGVDVGEVELLGVVVAEVGEVVTAGAVERFDELLRGGSVSRRMSQEGRFRGRGVFRRAGGAPAPPRP